MLKEKGYVFKTTCDTEVILNLYEEYGIDCLSHLQGMFAFAIWDPFKRSLFCARDRFGIKPFYYLCDKEKFVFGSEIKALMSAGGVDRTLSYEALDSYFAFGHISGDMSVYKNVKKLLPGHYLIVSFSENYSISSHKYWEVNFEPDHSKTEKYWMEEIKNCLIETIKLHMISDVPLGAFLSGGIDSSSVVAMMAKNSSQPLKTFSIGFKEKGFNELPYARIMAQKYGCDHHEEVIEPESISVLPTLVRCFDGLLPTRQQFQHGMFRKLRGKKLKLCFRAMVAMNCLQATIITLT
ncbi:MAG TPA: asparagine synthase-related protein [Bacteroidales bacterium]|nr:asparagine synthase-related protein [Bacteroidales bacterium]